MRPAPGGPARGRHRDRRDDGNAILETVLLGVLLLLPLLYGVLAIFTVQSGVFSATEAARQAGRALETTTDPSAGVERAHVAAVLAVKDAGLPTDPAHLKVFFVQRTTSGSVATATNPDCTTDRTNPLATEPPRLDSGDRRLLRVVLCVEVDVPVPYTDSSFLKGLDATIPVTGAFPLFSDDFRGGG